MSKKKIEVPADDARYLTENHKSQSVPVMAKALRRASATVYGFMDALGLPPLQREISRNHPFKRQNRKLETLFLGRRIENGQRKKD